MPSSGLFVGASKSASVRRLRAPWPRYSWFTKTKVSSAIRSSGYWKRSAVWPMNTPSRVTATSDTISPLWFISTSRSG